LYKGSLGFCDKTWFEAGLEMDQSGIIDKGKTHKLDGTLADG
jgi:hypothetical protein